MKINFKKILDMLEPVPASEKIFFANRLRVMIKAGISITEAITTLATETHHKKFKKILTEIEQSVEKGEQLVIALDKYPGVFSNFFRSMIRIGEVSGTLEKNLQELSNQMHKDRNLLLKIRGALTYPVIILIATIIIVVGMFIYVIPSLISVFESFNANLPLATRVLIAVSKLLTNYGLIVAILALAVIIILAWFFRTKGKPFWHNLLLHLLIIGPIVKKVNLARFSRTLSALLATDIPVVQGLEVTSEVLGNVHYRYSITRAAEEIKKGVPISEVLKQKPKLFPPMITTMIAVGEKSGTTDDMLKEVAEFYEADVDQITKNLSQVIEPLLILFLGAVVGGIALAIISPIYSLSQQI